MVKDIELSSAGVRVHLAPTTAQQDVVERIVASVRAAVEAMPDFTGRVEIVQAPPPAPARPRGPQPIPGVRSVLAVASGKGGVGKSTVATNLALALATLRPAIGLMDADVYGPSVPLMLGIDERARTREDRRIIPVEKHGLRVISMGMFVGEATPVIWRLGEVPLVRAIREASDRGLPIVAAEPSHPQSRAFREIAERVLVRLAEAERVAGP